MTTDTLLTDAAVTIECLRDHLFNSKRWFGTEDELDDLARQLREREAKAEGLDAARKHLVRALDAVPIEIATAMAAIERALAFVDAALATKPGEGESRG